MKLLELPNEDISQKQLLGLILLAYAFSFAIRLIWVYQFGDYAPFHYNNELMINTNDGYFFASGAQQVLFGMHEANPRVPSWLNYGVTFLTVLLTKITPFSLETVTLYMPSLISSLVVVPIILIARLFGATLWGFFAALLGSIAWSYYNRTMTGYYDTDMFAAMAPMFVLYFFMASVRHFTLRSALYAAIMIVIYPFLYDQGRAVVFAMSLLYFLYLIFYHRDDELTYKAIILVSLSTLPFTMLLTSPFNYIANIALLVVVYLFLQKRLFAKKELYIFALLSVILFLYFGNVFSLILGKVTYYLSRSVDSEGLHFFQVNQTISEAGKIPFSVMANRISGSSIGVIVSLIGYVLLVIRYRSFILTLPLIGIGLFSLVGGLRFTVFAVPIAAMSAVYLFYILVKSIDNKMLRYVLIVFFTTVMIYPNIKHIIAYRVGSVMNSVEVKVLNKLDEIASDKDYTLAWWDYGYPIWYYSNTNTLIDGGKHGHDNYLISKIFNTSSQMLAANLSRLAIEEYSKYGGIAADRLFKNQDPDNLLSSMSDDNFTLPSKTRDIYLYMPLRMLKIFPTVGFFSNLDLKTGIRREQPLYYKTDIFKEEKGIINLGQGVVYEKRRGLMHIGMQTIPVKNFITVRYNNEQKIEKNVQVLYPNGELTLIYMQSYKSFLVVDEAMYNSLFIQLFIFEEYDKSLFEPVIMTPYAKVYKLKK